MPIEDGSQRIIGQINLCFLTSQHAIVSQRDGQWHGLQWVLVHVGGIALFEGNGPSPLALNCREKSTHFPHRYSILPAISLDGLLFLLVLNRPFKAVDFNDFVDGLLDTMNPFPGPNSVIIMDNASIHKSQLLEPMVRAR